MKKTIKKLVACLLAVMMVATALPLSVFAADEETTTVPVAAGGVVQFGGNSRFDGTTMNIVNDGSDSNFDIGFWRFDISSLKALGATVTSANINVPVTSVGTDCTGLSFYYSITDNADAMASGTVSDSTITGTNDVHLTKAVEYYGMQLIKTIEKADVSVGTYTVDIAAAINAAIAADRDYCTLMVTQKTYGGRDDTGGWSDTSVTYSSNAISVKYTVASGGLAGTQAVTSSAVGLIQNEGAGRLESSRMNIVNDAQDGNFSIGFWKFDISALLSMGANISAAKMNVAVNAKDTECKGLSFYSATQATENLASGDNRVASLYGGGEGTHQAKALEYFGLGDPFATVTAGNITAGSSISVDLASAINNAIALKQKELTVMVMQSTAGGAGSSGGWTDTWLSNASVTVNCAYTVSADDIGTGVAALQKAIGIYETKMSALSSAKTSIYNNMVPAYNAYVKASAALDAAQYGNNAQAEADIDTLAQDLLGKTLKMTAWVDNVTGKYQSKVPSFQNTSADTMKSSYKDFYNNIIYTESCLSGNSDYTDDSNPSGLAGEFATVNGFRVQLYYPNTILLYDGSETGAVMPVMLMGKSTSKKAYMYIFRCYPTDDSQATFDAKKKFVGNDPVFQSLSKYKKDDSYAWKGGDGTNNLNFSAARGKSYKIGTASDEKFTSDSFKNKYHISTNYYGYWNPYATAFRINNTGFEYYINQQYLAGDGIGIYQPATQWVYYGSGDSSNSDSYSDDVRGYIATFVAESQTVKLNHNIYVVNYKALVDATKDATTRTRLSNVSQYKEGGLLGVITALNGAITFDVDSVTLDNISDKNTEITSYVDGAKAVPTADVDTSNYARLKAEILETKNTYDRGNADNKNYSAESWAPFAEAYENAVNTVSGFYNTTDNVYGIVTTNAATLYNTLYAASQALVLVKEVVNTTTLQYAIDNADAILQNMQYFVDSSVDETALSALITEAKTKIWGQEADYGFDPCKIDDTEENRAIVDDYLEKICTEVAKAVIDITAVVSDYNLNLDSAIAAGKAEEKNKDQYGNYAVLASAVQRGQAYHDVIPSINAKIENQVSNAISDYIKVVNDIGAALESLALSFRLVENGAIANGGQTITNEFKESTRGDQFNYKWSHYTDRVYFITNTDDYTTTLATSWTAYNAQTGTDFETILDSINVNADADTPSQEITSKSAAGLGWPSDFSMPQSTINTLKGNLGLIVNNMSVKWSDFKVTKRSSAKGLGVIDGSIVSNDAMDTTFDNALATTEGLSQRPNGIMAKSGEAVFTSTLTFNVTGTGNCNLDADHKPSLVSARINTNNTGNYMGLVYMWRYAPTLVQSWTGYSYARGMYDLDVGFVNLSTLFRLIDECESEDFLATANNYTTTSWDALTAAVANGKADMDYSTMSYEEIITECDTRYANILAAKKALKAPASNAKLKEIYNKAAEVYNNGQSTVKPSCWADFAAAFEKAAAKYQGEYSDLNIRNYDKTEQTNVDAVADELQAAYDALIYVADFTRVDNAVNDLLATLTDNKYTKESLNALATAISNLPYYGMSASQRAEHYTDEKDINGGKTDAGADLTIQQGINREAIYTIPALKDLLVEATIDTSALEAAKTEKRAQKNDPDAYDQDKITEALNKLNAYEKVMVVGKNVMAAKYTEQSALDNDIQNALDGIALKTYTVTVTDGTDTISTQEFEYGEQVEIAAPNDETVDWYYESVSPSSSTPKKYMTTGNIVSFVVKGDTTLTTKKASSEQTYKVTYVNSINSTPFAVEYVPAGSAVTVGTEYGTTNTYTVPQVAYFTFTDYSANGKTVSTGSQLTINANTIIYANYKAAETISDQYSVTVLGLSLINGRHPNDPTITGLHYNDELSFTQGSANGEGYFGANMYYDKTCYATGNAETETVEVKNAGRLMHTGGTASAPRPPVYVWVEVNADDMDSWLAAWKAKKIFNISTNQTLTQTSMGDADILKSTNAKIVAYGTDYTFRVSKPNATLLVLTEDQFKYLQSADYEGFYDSECKFDDNGASVTTQDEIVISNGKFSIVSTFAVPTGCKVVENGILYSADTGSKTKFTGLYTLGNVSSANNLIRIKSTVHTAGNQYVCSLTHTKLTGKKVSEVPMSWVAYLTYEDADGNRNTVYTPVTSPSNQDATL